MSVLLLYGGVALAGVSVIAGIVVAVIMWLSKHRIDAQLDIEYGKKR